VVRGILPSPAGEGWSPGSDPDRTYDLLLLGAAEPDIPVLRLLADVAHLNLRMVYDPDPSAPGLAVARELGIPCLSGALTLHLESPPDAVILARAELESHLESLHLESTARITRDEVELFLGDPEAFLDADRLSRPVSPIAAEPEDSPTVAEEAEEGEEAPEVDVEETGDGGDESPEAEAPEDFAEPDLESAGESEASFEPEPAPEPEPEESPTRDSGHFEIERFDSPPLVPAATPESEEIEPLTPLERVSPFERPTTLPPSAPETPSDLLSDDMGSLLGALDLLLDFERFANKVLQMAVRMTRGTSGSLMLVEENGEELRIEASTGLSDLVVQSTRQRIGEGIAGRVAEDGEPLLLVGRVGDERFRTRGERPEIRSSVCAPLVSDGRVVGVLNVNSDPELPPFDRDELGLVTGLGRQVGAPLDRSRQLRRMRGRSFELSVRGEIESIAASDLDAPTRMQRIASRLVQMLNADTCAIYLKERHGDSLVLGAIAGVDMRTGGAMSVPVGTGLVGWVAKNLRPLVLRSGSDPRRISGDFQLTSVGVPIRYHTDLIGVMTIETTSPGGVDDERLRLVASVASVVGQHVGESRAHEDSERKVTMLSALSELGVAFTAAADRKGLSRLVSFSAATVLESDVAAVRLLRPGASPDSGDPDWYELIAVHGASISGAADPLVELEDRIAREVVVSLRPRCDTDLEIQEIAPLLERSNVSAAMGVPLLDGKDLVGIVTVYRVVDVPGKRVPYREQDVEIGERLGDYAAAAASRFVGADAGGPLDEPSEEDSR
jgi:GAF domain-containing protein